MGQFFGELDFDAEEVAYTPGAGSGSTPSLAKFSSTKRRSRARDIHDLQQASSSARNELVSEADRDLIDQIKTGRPIGDMMIRQLVTHILPRKNPAGQTVGRNRKGSTYQERFDASVSVLEQAGYDIEASFSPIIEKTVTPQDIVDFYDRERQRYVALQSKLALFKSDERYDGDVGDKRKSAYGILKGFLRGYEHKEVRDLIREPFVSLLQGLNEDGVEDLMRALGRSRDGSVIERTLPLIAEHIDARIMLQPPLTGANGTSGKKVFVDQLLALMENDKGDLIDSPRSRSIIAALPAVAYEFFDRSFGVEFDVVEPVTPGDIMGYLTNIATDGEMKNITQIAALQAASSIARQRQSDALNNVLAPKQRATGRAAAMRLRNAYVPTERLVPELSKQREAEAAPAPTRDLRLGAIRLVHPVVAPKR